MIRSFARAYWRQEEPKREGSRSTLEFSSPCSRGPEPRVQATVKRWEEAPIPVPERLVKEVEDVLGKVFLGFSVFSVSRGGVGYGGSQSPAQNPESIPSGQEDNPLTHKPPRNRENRETEKQESSTSFQDEKRVNEAGTGSILHQEPSEKKQFREFRQFANFASSPASEGGHARCSIRL